MANDYILPDDITPKAPANLTVPPLNPARKPPGLLVPVAKELVGVSNQIAKNAGLSLLKPKFFVVDTARMKQEQLIYDSTHPNGAEEVNSIFGLPVFDAITFDIINYNDFNDKPITIPKLYLEIVLFEIDLPKNIIRTKVTGRDKDVLEFMSNGNYEIKITGSVVNPLANTPPEELIRALNAFAKSQVEIQVNSTVLAYFDIFSIVILNAKFIQKSGFRNVFDFELQCIDEVKFEIKNNA